MIDLTGDPLQENGVYDGVTLMWIPPRVYHSSVRMSRSRLRSMKRSPAHFFHDLYAEPDPPTPDMLMGDAVHAATLEPFRFLDEYLLEPDFGNHAKNPGRKLITEWRAEHLPSGKIVIPRAKARYVPDIAAKVRDHPDLDEIIHGGGAVETTVCWTDPATGLPMRARIDLNNETDDGPFLLDLKKVQDASPEAMTRQIANDALHLQAAMYAEGMTQATGIEHDRFGFVCFEEKPPHHTGLHELSPAFMEKGRKLYRMLLDDVARYMERKEWPDYSGMGVFTLEPPPFMKD